MICSFLIQYFYQTDALDYSLLAPFLPLEFGWFISKKLHQIFGNFGSCHRIFKFNDRFCLSVGFPEVIIWKTENK